MKCRLLLMALLPLYQTVACAQTMTVAYQQTINLSTPGALAAFSLDDFCAEGKVQDDTLTIFGRNPGVTDIVVIMAGGTKTLKVHVLAGAPSHPLGFIQPIPASAINENGSYESRYDSSTSQAENIVDFMRREGDHSVSFHLSSLSLVTPLPGQSTLSLNSGFYQMLTPRRDITVMDQIVNNSPLTVDGSIVRGFHFRQDGFLFHVGYTSIITFENLILPALREGIIGVDYRILVGDHVSLTPNFYFFPEGRASDSNGQRGTVASLVYDYKPLNDAEFLTEAGFSHGLGVATRMHFDGAHDQMSADLRYEPKRFASLGLNNLHGFYSDIDWNGYLTPRLTSTIGFTANHYTLPTLDLKNIVTNVNFQFQPARGWSVTSGTNYGSSEARIPAAPKIVTVGIPAGVNFHSRHFQGGFLYQISRNSGAILHSDEFRADLETAWSGFRLSTFADRQTQAPTISLVASGIPGLQQAVNDLAISATTPQQVANVLSDTAVLANQGLVNGVNINLVPVRFQDGADLEWFGRRRNQQRVHFSFLYNKDQLSQGTNRSVIGTLSDSWTFKNSNEIFASISLVRDAAAQNYGRQTSRLFEVSLRHQFAGVPNFIIPRRRGTIRGVVFADDGATGIYRSGAAGLVGVEVVLDDTRRVRTDRNGRFLFPGVSFHSHFVELDYRSTKPFFLTTASRVQSDADTEVNFGVGLSWARLSGYVLSDAGTGLPGIEVSVSKGSQHFNVQTGADGKFQVEGLPDGAYEIKVDVDSVPPGYSLAELKTQQAIVDATTPAQVSFTLRAIRNISGRVKIYDHASNREMIVPGIAVLLRPTTRTNVSDESGTYIFRDLSAGPYSVVILYQGREFEKDVVMPDGPFFPKDIEINLGAR
jgi:carboxypeptidase family protein